MASAPQSTPTNRLKLIEPLSSMLNGNKFLKWTESSSNNERANVITPVGVTLKIDDKCFILYWRDLNQPSNNNNYNKNQRRNDINSNSNLLKTEYLDISNIRDVRTGKYANVPKDKNIKELLLSGKSNFSIQDKTITIYYGNDISNIQSINFVSMSQNANEIAKEWSEFLFKCANSQRMLNLSPWESLMKLRSCLVYGKAIIDEKTHEFKLPVQILIDSFITNGKQNVESERQHIQHTLQMVGLPSGKNDMLDENILTCDKFFQLFLRIVSKEDIEQIFANYGTKRKLCMTAEQFENFLNKEQRDPGLNELLYPNYTVEKAMEFINKFEIEDSFRKKKQLSPQGLMRYLMDFENEIVDPAKYELNDDMEQPLSHYFINSSHNTYLTGHQITGKSDTEMYRQVLLSGCRCIELDCHDDDYLDEPVITHGRTLCTKILFSDVIHAINECAFKTSPYPVLLSFENFCSKKMLEKMAKYLVDILGDQLLTEPLSNYPLKPGVLLPSPEDLKYKILIKFRRKRLLEKDVSQSSISSINNQIINVGAIDNSLGKNQINQNGIEQTALNSNDSTIITSDNNSFKSDSLLNNIILRNNSSDMSDEDKEKDDNNNEHLKKLDLSNNIKLGVNLPNVKSASNFNKLVQQSIKVEKELVLPSLTMDSLVNYLQPFTFQAFEVSQKRNRSFELSSFVETNAFNLLKEKSTDFVNYNKKQLSRIYPKGTRISSDNFIPQMFWNVGCQLVALNFQTADLGMQLNQGKFEYNNKSGYLLKPEIMRRTDVNKLFDPFVEAPLDGIVAASLKIKIISGIFLQPRVDNEKRTGHIVTVELFGLPADSLRGQKAHRVKASSSNTFNVVYSDSGFTINKIIMPQLALLNISVFDEQNKMIAHRVLPIVGLRPGYRYISLKNESNRSLNMCMLFVHIKMQDYVPAEFEQFANALVNPINYVTSLAKKDEMLRTLTDENDNIDSVGADLYSDMNNNSNFLKELTDPTSFSKLDLKRHSITNINMLLSSTVNNSKKTLNNLTGSNSKLNDLQDNLNKLNSNFKSSNDLLENKKSNSNNNSMLFLHPDFIKINESFHSSENFFAKNNNLFDNYDNKKRKSQSDLLKINDLNVSLHNLSRSSSVSYTNELDLKVNLSINSQLYDPSLYVEIDLETLKTNKSCLQIMKANLKKIEKIEKETEKKINDLIQNLNLDLNKLKNEENDKFSRPKIENNLFKLAKKKLTTGSSKDNSTPVLYNVVSTVQHQQHSNLLKDYNQSLNDINEKYAKLMICVYEDAFKSIRDIKSSSIEPITLRMEKQIQEINDARMQKLQQISEKEISLIGKQTHQIIKLKKKAALNTCQNKEELQKISKLIEKDSVSLAVSENSKMEDLLRSKQKLVKQVTDKSMNELEEYKQNLLKQFETEFQENLNSKMTDIQKTYLNGHYSKQIANTSIKTNSANNNSSNLNNNNLKPIDNNVKRLSICETTYL